MSLQPELKLYDYQFAYRKGNCTEYAIIAFVNTVTECLDDSYVTNLFIDFSSLFNTIKPNILIKVFGAPPWSNGSVLDHRSPPLVFKSRSGHI